MYVPARSGQLASHMGAADVTESGKRDTQIMHVLGIVGDHPGHTSYELCRLFQRGYDTKAYVPLNQFRSRMSEAKARDLVVKCELKQCSISSFTAHVWRLPGPGVVAHCSATGLPLKAGKHDSGCDDISYDGEDYYDNDCWEE